MKTPQRALGRRWISVFVGLCLLGPAGARAESIGEAVEKHVEKELEGDKKVRKKKQANKNEDNKKKEASKKADKKKATARSQPKKKKRAPTASRRASPKNSKKAPPRVGEKARPASSKRGRSGLYVGEKRVNFLAPGREPPRIIGENFEIDPQVGFGLRGWHADDYPALTIQTQHYPQWYAGFQGRFFKHIRVYNAFYQSVGLKSPRNTGAVIAKAATKAAPGAATRALGMMGYQVKFILVPMFRYEARSYEATAHPNQPVRLIPFETSKDEDVTSIPTTEDDLYAISTFETFILGMHYNDRLKGPDGELLTPKFLPFYFGAGFTQYRKPYQVRVGDGVLDDLVFNSRFRGAGLALGFDIAGGINKLGINLATQAGLGQIQLLRDFTLNQALPNDWFIGYVQGDLKVDYTMVLLDTRPNLLLSPVASVGGTSFYYINKKGEGDGAPMANWDLLWMAMARLIVPL